MLQHHQQESVFFFGIVFAFGRLGVLDLELLQGDSKREDLFRQLCLDFVLLLQFTFTFLDLANVLFVV
jgi:hypothetical protein